jgi:hypothetical protein
MADQWNSVEIATLAVAAVTPVTVAAVGCFLARASQRPGHGQWLTRPCSPAAWRSSIRSRPVPPGVRVEAGGFGAGTDTEPGDIVPAGAPVVHVRGFSYKGSVQVRSRPPED